MSGNRLRLTVTIMLCAWLSAGFIDVGRMFESDPPSIQMIAATIAVIGMWPVVGWFAGRSASTEFVRIASIFWTTVIVGGLFGVWAANAKVGMIMLPLALASLMPLYGATNVLPGVEALIQTTMAASVGFALTLIAHFFGRRRHKASDLTGLE